MNKFSKKLINIVLKPVRAAVRGGFCIAGAVKKITFRGTLHGISRLGEMIVKGIYSVGFAVESFIVKLLKPYTKTYL